MAKKSDLEQIFEIVKEARKKAFLEIIEILEERNKELRKNFVYFYFENESQVTENENTIETIKKLIDGKD